jgi:hypothetical protein
VRLYPRLGCSSLFYDSSESSLTDSQWFVVLAVLMSRPLLRVCWAFKRWCFKRFCVTSICFSIAGRLVATWASTIPALRHQGH